eukprot:TRINITY_DN59997_c0_g1_i1.p1 TRINITY_DN59997_c0_g1~~TRINITY_DN59997_c0_g1_i1.p1  ORF type:complete len:499 (-),score=232.62 TRINITY_DN59997_c0_g1_i1:1077-2573(-)
MMLSRRFSGVVRARGLWARRAARSLRWLGRRSKMAAAVDVPVEVDNPFSGEVAFSVRPLSLEQCVDAVEQAAVVRDAWRGSTLADRKKIVESFLSHFESRGDEIARSVTRQMGKPLQQAKGEVTTAIARARALVDLAGDALEPLVVEQSANVCRKIEREPIGVVLSLVPWNYPLLCSVNSVVAAVLAGNPVLLKTSDRTPECAEFFAQCFDAADGAPSGLVRALHASHEQLAGVIQHPDVAFVSFTGSVSGGRAVYGHVGQHRFIDATLELGGKDGAYVAADVADASQVGASLVDGACFNAGQSCCAVERAYVHESVYDDFVAGASRAMQEYRLGDPMDASTTMGPMAQATQPVFVNDQVQEAVAKGAQVVTGGDSKPDHPRFYLPTLITECTHDMTVMTEETFGPVLAVQKVASDEQGVALINDSKYGLTSSIWTSDAERAHALAPLLNTGTVFMNRCDFLDPYLAWSGRKDSGKGISLSGLGFAAFTRTKSYNFAC